MKRIFGHPWFIKGIGLLAFALLVWFVGPLIAISDNYFLDSIASRLLLILIVVFIVAANEVRKLLVAKRKNKQLLNEMGADDNDVLAEESQIIRERFEQAVDMLKSSSSSKRGKNYLYELPWYIIIGPPGSGKTTALLNSGLEFPLEDRIGLEAVKGIGGTRHCDWWFTSDAVLIDTAGRFTTQDSQKELDQTAWTSFMSLLKRYRKQRPINGALVAVSITDLLTLSENDLMFYAKTIRKRIEELSQHLNTQFPVYFMFTKCDMIAGFNDFFGDLESEQRAQVWGHTFALSKNSESDYSQEELSSALDALYERIHQQLIERVANERDPEKKARIIGFPAQFGSLKQGVEMFLSSIFGSNRFQSTQLLRGVYFTSGTQQGTPFDQLLGNMAQQLGMDSNDSLQMSSKGRSYFIKDLLTKVIIPEADIAGVDQSFKRILQRLSIAGYVVASMAAIALAVGLIMSYQSEKSTLLTTENQLLEFEKAEIQPNNSAWVGSDFQRVLEELNAARATKETYNKEVGMASLGLSQQPEFSVATNSLYQETLENKLLPMIKARLEELLINIINDGDTSALYDVLKAYLMYAGMHERAEVPFERDWLFGLFEADWQRQYAIEKSIVEQLKTHHGALLDFNFNHFAPNEQIVSAARETLKRMPLSEQVYLNVKQSLESDRSKNLYIRDIAGNFSIDVFRSRSNQDVGGIFIPGMFTKSGFYNDFIPNSAQKAQDYLDNNWVLGAHNSRGGEIDRAKLTQDLYQRYYRDYIDTWSKLLRDITLVETQTVSQGAATIEQFTSINGPLETLVYTVASETNLSQPMSSDVDMQAAGEAAGVVSSTAQRAINQANRISRVSQKAGLASLPGQVVSDHFAAFHRLVESSRGEPALNRIMQDARSFSLFINQTMFDGFSPTTAFDAVNARLKSTGRDPFMTLKSARSLMPQEMQVWFNTLSSMGWKMLLTQAKSEINGLWQQEILPTYERAIEGRYPFDGSTDIEVELRDFSSFFRPDGLFDGFLNTYLEPFLNTRSPQWTEKALDGETFGLSSSTISQLQNAHKITELFFSGSAMSPRLSFTMTPKQLDGNVAQFQLQLGSQQLLYAHGPRRSRKLVWPLEQGDERAQLMFTSVDNQNASELETGPWSLFRLLDNHRLSPTAQNSTFEIVFSTGGFNATYELRVDTEFNPIGARLLQSSRMPREL
ncbi:type VI secretion system membrane subunit TssM [Aestuariibacter salexigens]|uniref:type VI secretion system membrane subunit TssM n=1 Tax=Aestuariibacter salexigens TaxID=226010 RepID=UPI00047945E0|nr:type VI secretion system membrane subunit TssM [Aestuariibacter salexigens]